MTSVANSSFVGWPSDGHALICSAAKPRPDIEYANNFTWVHQDGAQVGGCQEGCCADFECKACGAKYSVGEHGKSPV